MKQVPLSKEITHSEERFQAFVLASSDVVYRMSPDWSEMRHLCGKRFIADTTDPTQGWIEKYILPEDRPAVLAAIQRAIETKSIFELEHRVIRVDGTVGWTFSRAIPIFDAQNEIVEWFGAASDITERKRSEERLARLSAESEAQTRFYDAILSSTPDLVYLFDLNHRFTYANRALLTMWGKTWEEAIGKTCLELGYEPWHAAMHDREIEQVIATKQLVRGDVPFSGTHGRRIYDYIFVPVFGPSGEVEAVAGTTRDVTERYLAEQDLLRANQDLEQFAYATTHDLQEPVRTMRLYSEWLSKKYGTELDGQALEILHQITGSAARMQNLIQDLFSYTQAGRSTGTTQRTEAAACLEAVLANLATSIKEAEGSVTFDRLPKVRIQPTQLEQVFQNLIGNALKYRRQEATPVIHISAGIEDGLAHFIVADNGIGIEDRYREQIFGLFKRLHGNGAYPGTGIGLSLCRRILERNHGQIWVESRVGEGSQFHFTVPV